jgi:hypothetical protein
MAINIDTQDLVNYPGNVKRVTVDQESVVPQGQEGDEQFMLSFSTTAYSNIASRTAIQDYYITSFKAGWCKSSGFAGNNFALDNSHCSLEVKIDSTVSGVSDGYYRITLDENDGVPIDGEVVAADMETKIRALADNLDTADIGYKLAYMNAVVEFTGGRFWIVSGSLSEYYSGTYKSAVRVRESSVNDCSAILGFNVSISSEQLASVSIKEALVTTTFSGSTASGTSQITINQSIGVAANDCMVITDGSNSDYFQVSSVDSGVNISFNADTVSHDYTASGAKVQILKEQDPNADPALWFNKVDKITRHGIKTIVNQIDYSS